MRRVRALPSLAPRRPDAHKGDYGRVFVVGGSTGMAGAPCLCGQAALRSGAGLVTVAVPESLYPIVAAKLTNCMTLPLPERDGGIDIAGDPEARHELDRADVVALGPGLGRSAGARESARRLASELSCAMVIDADGLNAFAGGNGLSSPPSGPRVLTPHPGEMARLMGMKHAEEVQEDREEIASRAAVRFGAVVVLKGHRTVVTDGERLYVNTTGNPGMATGGTGDVLTGVVAGLLAQGLTPFDAAQLGVFIHGLAGDVACRGVGEVSLVATDLLDALPEAFLTLTSP